MKVSQPIRTPASTAMRTRGRADGLDLDSPASLQGENLPAGSAAGSRCVGMLIPSSRGLSLHARSTRHAAAASTRKSSTRRNSWEPDAYWQMQDYVWDRRTPGRVDIGEVQDLGAQPPASKPPEDPTP